MVLMQSPPEVSAAGAPRSCAAGEGLCSVSRSGVGGVPRASLPEEMNVHPEDREPFVSLAAFSQTPSSLLAINTQKL